MKRRTAWTFPARGCGKCSRAGSRYRRSSAGKRSYQFCRSTMTASDDAQGAVATHAMILAQITDTHILAKTSDDPAGASRAENLRRCVADINARGVEAVIHTG